MTRHDFLTLDDIDHNGKRVFLRVDINVPLDPTTHQILDDTRIRAITPTLNELDDAAVVIGSHQSRPGKDDFTSLEPHTEIIKKNCNRNIRFIDDILGSHARQEISKLQPGEVLVLDNLRFCSEENIDDKPDKQVKTHLVKRLAPQFDLYINDAFATAHRSQPSITGLSELLPSAAGRLMEKELEAVSNLLVQPRRPCVYVLGGAKVEDKIPVIEHILARDKADKILLGGVPAKLFLAANNPHLSLEEGGIQAHQAYLGRVEKLVKAYKDRIVLPVDLAFEEHGKRTDHPIDNMPRTPSLDIGRKTAEKYSKIIQTSATTVANGPLGVFETNDFDLGTKTVLESMAGTKGYTVIGGGHLVGLATIHGIEDQFSHVSTAGGAMLSLLAGQNRPGVDALIRAAAKTRQPKD